MTSNNSTQTTFDRHLSHSLIFHIPHTSLVIPNILRNQFLLSDEELKNEHLKLVDRYADELFNLSGYPQVISSVSRLVCDVERFIDDEQEQMTQVGMGAIYLKTTDGKNLRRELSHKEHQYIIEKYYMKNQSLMEDCIENALRSNGTALIIDCHSFPSVPLPCDINQRSSRPDICIGTDSYQSSSELITLVTEFFTDHGYSIKVNSPFSGTYIPQKYSSNNTNTAGICENIQRVESIMIEVNRSLYMNENTGEKLLQFDKLKKSFKALWVLLEEYIDEQICNS